MRTLADGVERAGDLRGAPKRTYSIAWSPDGRWLAAEGSQELEVETALSQFGKRRRPIIPVVLDGVRGTPRWPPFLELWQAVDLRVSDPDPIDRLVWGITGERRMA